MATLFPTRGARGAVFDGCARLVSRIVNIIASFRRSVKISRSEQTTYGVLPVASDNNEKNNAATTIERSVGIDLGASADENHIAFLFGEPVRRPTPGCVEGSQRIEFGYVDVPRDFPWRLEDKILTTARAFHALAREAVEEFELQGHDALTQLLTRRIGEEALERELAHAARLGTPLCVVFLDADGLKRVNDTLGHPVGDAVLRAIGASIRECSRASDVKVRWGGDEFVVAMPNTTPRKAGQIARKVHKVLAAKVIAHEGREINASLSFGVALSQVGDTPKTVVKRADDGMFANKNEKRTAGKVLHFAKDEA